MGEDCAGAVRFVRPENADRAHKGGRERLDEEDIGRRLEALRKDPAMGREPGDRGQFDKLARTCEFPARSIRKIVVGMAERMPDAADRVASAMIDQGVTHPVVSNLVESLKKRASEKAEEFSSS